MEKQNLLFEFNKVVDQIYGVYLDSTAGFVQNYALMGKMQKDSIRKDKFSQDYLDNCALTYGTDDPDKPRAIILHKCSQKEFKERNSSGGNNYKTIGNLCVVQIYQFWEDCFRSKIASKLFCKKDQLKSEVFGDLNFLRRSIIHNQAIADKDISKCKIFKWFKEGEEIKFTEKQIEKIIRRIKIELDGYNFLITEIEKKIK
jgi:hypothetical protein